MHAPPALVLFSPLCAGRSLSGATTCDALTAQTGHEFRDSCAASVAVLQFAGSRLGARSRAVQGVLLAHQGLRPLLSLLLLLLLPFTWARRRAPRCPAAFQGWPGSAPARCLCLQHERECTVRCVHVADGWPGSPLNLCACIWSTGSTAMLVYRASPLGALPPPSPPRTGCSPAHPCSCPPQTAAPCRA